LKVETITFNEARNTKKQKEKHLGVLSDIALTAVSE